MKTALLGGGWRPCHVTLQHYQFWQSHGAWSGCIESRRHVSVLGAANSVDSSHQKRQRNRPGECRNS